MTPPTPIVFIGMHRSGTSVVGRLLEQLGLYAGAIKDENNEAVFFQELNIWLMAQVGARWDFPGAIDYLLRDDNNLSLSVQYLSRLLRSPRTLQYLGFGRYFRYHTMFSLDFPWGWKDPRNTFTLPIWLHLYPNAKVVYIERHGVDVAQSLKLRREQTLEQGARRLHAFGTLYSLRPKTAGFCDTVRCSTLQEAFTLWQEYVERGRHHAETLGQARCMALRFEQLLTNGPTVLRQLADFCNLDASDAAIVKVLGQLRLGRSFAYRTSPELRAFAERMSPHLMGYEP